MTKLSVRQLIFVVFMVTVFSFIPFMGRDSLAAAVSWKLPVDGNWNDPIKWDTGVVPSSTDNVSIIVDGTYTVTMNVSATVVNLTLGGSTGTQTLVVNGTTLTMVEGTNHGKIELTSSSPTGVATLTGGTLTNASDGDINVIVGNGGSRRIYLQLDNQGTVTVNQPLTISKASAQHKNSGTMEVNQNVTLTQSGTSPSFTNSGTIRVAGGKMLTVNGGDFIFDAGTALSGAGEVYLSGVAGALAADVTMAGNLRLNNSTVSGAYKLTIGSGGALTLTGGDIEINTDNTEVLNGGKIVVSYGHNSINGVLTVGAGAEVQVDGSDPTVLNVANGVNHGTIGLTSSGGSATLGGGTLTNASDGNIDVIIGAGGSRWISLQLDNQGTVTVNQPLTISKASAKHRNSGTIEVNENVTLTQWGTSESFTNSGTIRVASGKMLTVNGGDFIFDAGTALSGAGVVYLNGVAGALAADVTMAGNLRLNNSTVSGAYKLTIGSGGVLTLTGGDIEINTDNTEVLNGGKIVASYGHNSINGVLTVGAGAEVRVNGSDGTGTTLNVASGTNHGTIEMTSSGSGGGATLGGGTLTNASDGNIDVIIGAGGSRWISLQLDNRGTVTLNQPLTISKASAKHTNSGTIEVNENLTVSQSGTSPSFTNSGIITVPLGKTLQVNLGTFTNASGGILQGTGTINVSSASFSNAGSINPGTSAGTLTFTGNVPQTSTGAMNIEIGGLSAGTQHDRINISGTATLSGILNVMLISAFDPNVGDTFTVVNYGSKSGTFTTTHFPSLSGGKQWKIIYNATSVVLSIEIPVPEINVKQGTTNIADGTGSYNFGNVIINSNKMVTFTIESLGTGPLNLTGSPNKVQINGSHASDFSVTSEPATPVPAGNVTTFAITFTPTGGGVRTATVSIANDDSDENPYGFTVSGTGVAPEINIKVVTTSIPDNTGAYDFGAVNRTSNKAVTFTIENLGTSPLNLIGTPKVQVGGANSGDFVVTTQPGSPITDGTSNTFVITFTPGAVGPRTATVTIPNDDSDENPYNLTISGTGVEPEINIKVVNTSIPDNTGTYDFGAVIRTSNKAVTFTIENLGTSPLNLTGTPKVQAGGANSGDFVVTTQPGSPITDGTFNTFVITFTPGAVGPRTATVSIPNDDSDENPYNFTISGTGVEPDISVKQDGTPIPIGTGKYDFGTVTLGYSKAITFTIENSGTAPLSLTGTQITGPNQADFLPVTTQPTTPVPAGGSTTFVITFTPGDEGVRSAAVTINNDVSGKNPYTFTIEGAGGHVPVADAGPDQNVAAGVEVNLDGSDSYDLDGQSLTFLWSLVSKPPASGLTDADIEGKTTPNPSFVPDVVGIYRFRLVVNDGFTDSDPDTVEIHAFLSTDNIPPNARAGKGQHAKINTLVVLDGSGSYDPDDGPAGLLSFQWSFKAVPSGSALLGKPLIDSDQVSASFVPDVPGVYTVELEVYDGLETDRDEVTIQAYSTNVPPNARAGQDRKVGPGEEVTLDGTMSFDQDGGPGPLTYQWRFVFVPSGSTLTNGNIVNVHTGTPKFTPDVEGTYVVELTVSDGLDTDFDHVMVMATTEPWVEVTPPEGTVGTEFTLKRHNDEVVGFGAKGKLYMGKKTLKAVTWMSQSILIRVTKANPPGTYDIRILPKKPKNGIQQTIWGPRCFAMKVPEMGEVTYLPVEQKYRVTGKFFGKKKGKIYLGDLACKVKTWSMIPATNESEATFLLPKGVTSGTLMLNVVNKVGRGKKRVTLP